jgi:hypothetical protein
MENGYKKYCDQHRYIHDDEQHAFVYKTQADILESEKFNAKMVHYQNYLNKIFQIALEYYELKIKKTYSIVKVPIKDLPNIVDWLRAHKNVFKSKFVIDSVTNTDDNKYIFNNYVDIYLPEGEDEIPL